jgi:hypothetical protein
MSRRPLLAKLSVSLGVILLFGLLVVAVQSLFTQEFVGANDFYPRWKGAQLYWLEGIDPYSEAATAAIQEDMYGRPALPDEDQVLFVYPFYTIFLLLPLIWLPLSYSWIQAIWLVLILFSLVASALLCLVLLRWQIPLWLWAVILLWTVIFYNSTRTIILGQFAGLVLLSFVLALLYLRRGRDGWAGFWLVWTTLKPQMVFLLLPLLFLWAIYQGRWRLLIGFGASLGVLVGVSLLLLPSWPVSFVQQVLAYPGYTAYAGSPMGVITDYLLPAWPWVEGLVVGLLVGFMLWTWRDVRGITAVSPQLFVVLGITMSVTNLILPRTATTNHILLYLPLFLLLQLVWRRWPLGSLWIALFLAGSVVGMWALFLATIVGDQEHPVMYLPLPLLILGALLVYRYKPGNPAWVDETAKGVSS